jgi:hypothetical protein
MVSTNELPVRQNESWMFGGNSGNEKGKVFLEKQKIKRS